MPPAFRSYLMRHLYFLVFMEAIVRDRFRSLTVRVESVASSERRHLYNVLREIPCRPQNSLMVVLLWKLASTIATFFVFNIVFPPSLKRKDIRNKYGIPYL